MLTLFLLALLLAALLVPPLALLRRADRLGWAARYGLAVLPAAYTWGGYRLAVLAIDWFACQGGMKGLHACTCAGLDVTPLVGHGLFLSIPGLFVAAPLALWLLLDTAVRHLQVRDSGPAR